ncbi:hypothetical protein DFH29DRAFT_881989 [Suillus ampliporus]|nr:hypothetical protein DFH29DRAFT_881989 [Suillus ampliporus]
MAGLPCPPGYNPQLWLRIPEPAQLQIWKEAASLPPPIPSSSIDPALLGQSNGARWVGVVAHRVHYADRDRPHAALPFPEQNTEHQQLEARPRERGRQENDRRGTIRRSNGRQQRESQSGSPLVRSRNARRPRSCSHSGMQSRESCHRRSGSDSDDSLSRPLSSSVQRTSEPPEMLDLAELTDLVRSIRDDQLEDRDRLDALEGSSATRPSRHASASTAQFGRGGTAVARRRGVYRRTAAEHDDMADKDKDEDETREDVSKPKNLLSKDGKDARKYLKAQITITFRRICSVKAKDKWPLPSEGECQNADTGEVYYTPDFTCDVQDPTNVEIFHKVANITWSEMQKEKDNWPKFLKTKKIRWNKSMLIHFARETFRGFKSKSRAETDPEHGTALEINQRTTQWSNRRKEKAGNLLSNVVIEEYKAQNGGIDPSPLIIPDHMSDEASGPEDEDKPDTYDGWKCRMATLAGFGPETPTSHLKLLEVIHPQWRSAAQSKVFDNLCNIWWTGKSAKEREKFSIRVRDADIPKVSPYNFGINFDWLDDACKERLLEERLKDWAKYGNPTGFEAGGDCNAGGEGPEAEGDVEMGAEEDNGTSEGDHVGDRDGAADDSETSKHLQILSENPQTRSSDVVIHMWGLVDSTTPLAI